MFPWNTRSLFAFPGASGYGSDTMSCFVAESGNFSWSVVLALSGTSTWAGKRLGDACFIDTEQRPCCYFGKCMYIIRRPLNHPSPPSPPPPLSPPLTNSNTRHDVRADFIPGERGERPKSHKSATVWHGMTWPFDIWTGRVHHS